MTTSFAIHTFPTKRITISTRQPVVTLLASFDAELRRDAYVAGESDIEWQTALAIGDKAHFEKVIQNRLGPSGFMIFTIRGYDPLYDMYFVPSNTTTTRKRQTMVTYTIGNPLIARTMLIHDTTVGLNVPFSVAIVGDDEQSQLIYHAPSSLIVGGTSLEDGDEKRKLEAAAKVLDGKIEVLLAKIVKAGEAQ